MFNNSTFSGRVYPQPVAGLTGIWGIQYQTQTMSKHIPRLRRCSNWSVDPCHKKLKGKYDPSKTTKDDYRKGLPLIENKNTQLLFCNGATALERFYLLKFPNGKAKH